ncbi:OmpH family outer membrane protein [Halosquirtibacter laminarini]|uniref:OmpH family outer membrane protein n=1 Tax=Halosquirtibacter laminarini TaxID=3374600 RepID=A0AC61NN99_9BACT|nr:OmpH family outer membrane protein [Prolixibacteraceae bacterium]
MNNKTRNSLLIALSLILTLSFNACNPPAKETTVSQKTVNNGRIAFVKMDSLVMNYYLAKQMNEELKLTQEGYNKEFATKKTKFAQDAQSFQSKLQRGGFLTEANARKERDRIVAMESEVKKMDYELSNKLSKIQGDNNKRILDSLNAVLDRFQAEHHYKYILDGAAVLRSEGAENITDDILAILNAGQK